MCAVLLILARLLKLGFIANFLSRSVLIGFLTGVGIQVAMGQFGGLFGVSEGSGTTIEKFVNGLQAIPTQTNVPTLLVSLAVLGTIIGLERVNKKIPGALIAVVGAIVLNYVFDLTARGVTDLGPVPGGLPALGLPTEVMTASNVTALLPTVVSIVIVILAQSAATSRAYAIKYGDSFEENVDLIGLGLANVGAGISGTFVVNGSPTKTSMVDNAGGKSQLAMLTTAAVVVIVLLFLTVPLSYMPNAVLSAVVFLIGIRLIDVKGMTEIYRLRKGEFAVAAATAATVVIVGVEQGIILAIFLSIVEHIYHSYHPFDRLLTLSPTGRVQYVAHGQPAQAAPGLAIFAFGATLYYANSTRFTAEVLDVIDTASPPLKWFCLASAVIGDVDYSGSDAMHSVLDEMDKRGITFVMAGVNADVRDMLDRYGLVARIGPEYFFDFVDQVVEAYEQAVPAAPNEPASPPSSAPTDPAPTDPIRPDPTDPRPSRRAADQETLPCPRFRTEPSSATRVRRRAPACRQRPTRRGSRRPTGPTRSRCSRSRPRRVFPSSSPSATAAWRSRRSRSSGSGAADGRGPGADPDERLHGPARRRRASLQLRVVRLARAEPRCST